MAVRNSGHPLPEEPLRRGPREALARLRLLVLVQVPPARVPHQQRGGIICAPSRQESYDVGVRRKVLERTHLSGEGPCARAVLVRPLVDALQGQGFVHLGVRHQEHLAVGPHTQLGSEAQAPQPLRPRPLPQRRGVLGRLEGGAEGGSGVAGPPGLVRCVDGLRAASARVAACRHGAVGLAGAAAARPLAVTLVQHLQQHIHVLLIRGRGAL
mmetsp:Transcript_114990/g.320329  ORF Transcript_114990/g.320329 Transcript_114990/m.320329 type:complete len:212 (-) Transcript_114990:725-1360(-)